jgi:hypothetical protein
MKALNIYGLIIILCLITIFNSCSKDSDIEQQAEIYGTMQAKIGFMTYELTSVIGAMFIQPDGRVTIAGLNCDKKQNITINVLPEIGIYSLEEDNTENTAATLTSGKFFPCVGLNDISKTEYEATGGSVTIIESTPQKITGSFHFLGESYGGNTVSVNNGTFEFMIK